MPGPVKAKSVDAWFEKLPAKHKAVASEFRKIVQEAAPELRLEIKHETPWFMGKGYVAVLLASKKHVGLGFYRGAELRDPKGLLSGEGKAMRGIYCADVGKIPRAEVVAWVQAATLLDEKS